MRTTRILRHTLLLLSLLAIPSIALASEAPGKPTKSDSSNPRPASKHTRRPTARVSAEPSAQHQPARPRHSQSHADSHPSTQAKSLKPHAPKTPARAQPHKPTAHVTPSRPASQPNAGKSNTRACVHDPVTIVRGSDNHTESFALTRCNGRPVEGALERFTALATPQLTSNPGSAKAHPNAKHPGNQVSHLPKHLDSGLLARVQAIATQFPGKPIRIASAYRPQSGRSFHQSGKALDLVLSGVRNEDLVAFCRTLPDTGCGYYPNSSFVHVDVRTPRTGHVYWIDASKPGEPARYAWPEPKASTDAPSNAPADVGEHDHPSDAPESTSPAANSVPQSASNIPSADTVLDSQHDDKEH